MNPLIVLPLYAKDYCSQVRLSVATPRNLEEGARVVQQILHKTVLCYHDVQDIVRIYNELDLLERRLDVLTQQGTPSVLRSITQKVASIFSAQLIDVDNLISLFYLKKFKELPIDGYFNVALNRINLDSAPERKLELVNHLPCCHSEDEFNGAKRALIGDLPPDSELEEVLNTKLKKLRKNEDIKIKIPEKLRDLEHCRAQNPRINYPSYLEKLINRGYLCLSDHIIAVKEAPDRDKIIKRDMTFADVSQVILEAREAIIQQVEESIPTNSRNFLFLLGNTRAGKSTTLCFLKGDELKLNEHHYEVVGDTQNVNHSEENSCTFLPVIEVINQEGLGDIVLVDFPGFHDTNGSLVSLGIELAIRALTKKYRPKVLVIDAISSDSAFASQEQLGRRLARLLTIHDHRVDCVVGLTKYSRDAESIDIKNINERLDLQQEALGNPNITEQRRRDLNRQISADTESLVRLKRTIENRENAILARVLRSEGFARPNDRSRLIKLDDLDRRERREEVLRSIWEAAPQVRFEEGNHSLKLDENERALLTRDLFEISERSHPEDKPRFLKQLLSADAQPLIGYHVSDEDLMNDNQFIKFEQTARQFSLIKALTFKKSPEISCFLHLPEMDKTVIKELDLSTARASLRNYMSAVINIIAPCFLEKYLNAETLKGLNRSHINDFNQALISLRGFIGGLEGLTMRENAEQEFNELARRRQMRWDQIRMNFRNSFWGFIPVGIFEFFGGGKNEIKQFNQANILEYTRSMGKMERTIRRLKNIEDYITIRNS